MIYKVNNFIKLDRLIIRIHAPKYYGAQTLEVQLQGIYLRLLETTYVFGVVPMTDLEVLL